MAERLVHVPEARTVPDELLERLRLLHPRAELVYAGDGRWLYGYVGTNTARQALGERILAREMAKDPQKRRQANLLLGELVRQGFQLVTTLDKGEPEDIYNAAQFHAHLLSLGEKKLDEMFEQALNQATIEDERDGLRGALGEHARREMPLVLRVVRNGPKPMVFRPLQGAQ
jgi:hypothetical protein